MNEWHRLDGPTRCTPEPSMTGDDARGEYFWTSLYGCGLARAEVTHYLAAHDIMADWGNDDDDEGSRVGVVEITHTYVVKWSNVYGEYSHDESGPEDYEYESVGLFDFELNDAERAYRALDEHGVVDMSWAFCGPDSKADEVYDRQPAMVWWNNAMKSLDTATVEG